MPVSRFTITALWLCSIGFVLLLSTSTASVDAFVPPIRSCTSRKCTSLDAKKNSSRAHVERQFEDSMGDDWRVFRAKLVAQEKMEAAAAARGAENGDAGSNSKIASVSYNRELSKQAQLGDLFGSAINSIFHSKQHAAAAAQGDIFVGDAIGGIPADTVSNHEDPFVSAAELPLLIEPKVAIDKHRWAHPIPHVEPGSVLIANEKLGGVFHQTVVLIIQHNDQTGSVGIVINRYVHL